MLIYVNPSSGVPAYRQIMDQIKRLIAAGQLAPASRIDSVRQLAGRLHVNPMTVAKAYVLLTAQGVVSSRPGRGVFVAPPRRDLTRAARREALAGLLDQLVAEAHQLGIAPEEVMELVRNRFVKARAEESGTQAAAETRQAEAAQPVVAKRQAGAGAESPAGEPPAREPVAAPAPSAAPVEEDVALL